MQSIRTARPAHIAASATRLIWARHRRRRRSPPDGEDGASTRVGVGAPTAIRIVGSGWNEVLVASGVPDFGLGDLFGASTSVSGKFGHGLLARTAALSVLFLDDGRLAAGVVTPARLEAALS